MGVPKFYRWLSERYPCLSQVVKEHQIPVFDNLYLDMNGIIHLCSHPNDEDAHFRISEEKIFQDIFHYLEVLFYMIRPREIFFLAVDGVAPRAKMNQQRGRRFRSAKEAEAVERRAKEKGEVLPTEERFDSNCITPGTEFMARLQEQLKYFITSKVTSDKLWRDVRVILSGHETPGEGEHKIMEFIRYQKSQADYNPNTRHCLYGLDADLIMLGMCTHDPHFSLLREEVLFGGKKSQSRSQAPEETTFHLLHLTLLREYLEWEFASLKLPGVLPFGFDLERVVDDWVLMGFLVGNDFIPNLPELHINKEALPILYKVYTDVLPKLGGYINDSGKLNLERFQIYMETLAEYDFEKFCDKFDDSKYIASKVGNSQPFRRRKRFGRKIKKKGIKHILEEEEQILQSTNFEAVVKSSDDEDIEEEDADEERDSCDDASPKIYSYEESQDVSSQIPKRNVDPDLAALIQQTEDFLCMSDEEGPPKDMSDEELSRWEFKQHKRNYYVEKMNYTEVTQTVLREQAECYVRAIQWTLHYYYNGVCSWSWFYPHHYAPYISDVCDFKDMKLEFNVGKPFLPFEQLLAVLPAASRKLLPEAYQRLMTDVTSPILEFYPLEFKTDLNGKQQDWEAVVLIPFIDENRLVEAMKVCELHLTSEERRRNIHGPMISYTFSADPLGLYPSPGYFPPVAENHALARHIHRDEFCIPSEKLVRGLCPGVLKDVYICGFPTLKQIKHKGYLSKASVKVFNFPSKSDSMILEILKHPKRTLEEAAQFLGKTVYVGWPHLAEARVVSVTDGFERIFLKNTDREVTQGNVGHEALQEKTRDTTVMEKNRIEDRYFDRYGIVIGPVEILVAATPLLGKAVTFETNGDAITKKQWAKTAVNFSLQTVLTDVESPNLSSEPTNKSLASLFPIGSFCFLLSHPHYGCKTEVLSIEGGKVITSVYVTEEPNIEGVRKHKHKYETQYMPGSVAAQKVGFSSHLLARLMGSIFVTNSDSDNKINIGLNLKFNRRLEEVPGYTRRTQDGFWLYSHKAVQLLVDYADKFKEVMEYLGQNENADRFNAEDVFPEGDSKAKIHEIVSWLKSQPYAKEGLRRKCGGIFLDEGIISALEHEVNSVDPSLCMRKRLQVRPQCLYSSEHHEGRTAPDPSATYALFDRIVSVRHGFTVPFGTRGTVVGIHEGESDEDKVYEVLFDIPFTGGLSIRCSKNRAYRMTADGLINISHGFRLQRVRNNFRIQGVSNRHKSNICTQKHSAEQVSFPIVPHALQSPLAEQLLPSLLRLPEPNGFSSGSPGEFFAFWKDLQSKGSAPMTAVATTTIPVADETTGTIAMHVPPTTIPVGKHMSASEFFQRTKDVTQDAWTAPVLSDGCADMLNQLLKEAKSESARYICNEDPAGGTVKACCILPNNSSFVGLPSRTKQEAENNAAKCALEAIQRGETSLRQALPFPSSCVSQSIPVIRQPPPSALPFPSMWQQPQTQQLTSSVRMPDVSIPPPAFPVPPPLLFQQAPPMRQAFQPPMHLWRGAAAFAPVTPAPQTQHRQPDVVPLRQSTQFVPLQVSRKSGQPSRKLQPKKSSATQPPFASFLKSSRSPSYHPPSEQKMNCNPQFLPNSRIAARFTSPMTSCSHESQ